MEFYFVEKITVIKMVAASQFNYVSVMLPV